MKITYRIPTKDQYAFVEIVTEFEGNPIIEEAEVRNVYDTLTAAFKDGEGLPPREWAKFRNEYLAKGAINGDPGQLESLSKAQLWWVQETKKALASKK